MKEYIVGLGEILWDVLPEGKKLGGAPANFAYHVAQFGYNAIAISAIGNDVLGEEIKTQLEARKLPYLLSTVDFPTGVVQVKLDAKGVPDYEICEGVAWDNIPFTAEMRNVAHHTKALCFGSLAQRSEISQKSIASFIEAMPTNALKVFDINLRKEFYTRTIIEDSLLTANILKINDEELFIVSSLLSLEGSDIPSRCLQLIERYQLRCVVLTCGTDGSYVFTPSEQSFLPTPRVEVADTVGAGDSFTAAFISSLLAGRSIAEAHRLAVEVSAYVCTQTGAMPLHPESFRQQLT